MTNSQMSAWLEAMPEAARLLDSQGQLVGQNIRAQGHNPEGKHITTHDLGDGWQLETWPPIDVANPDVRSLANGLAHTLRNPLSSILTAADLVKDDPKLNEESQMLLGIIAKESRQLNRILTDFLNYVRPRSTAPTAFDLAKAIRDSVAALRQENLLPDTVKVQDDLPPALLSVGDEHAIRQSLHHVVKNAVEAMNGQGTLRLYGETFDSHGLVHVEDSGPGFSNESLQRAFEPFYSYTPECAGLGLSVALAAVQRAGGRITVENIPHDDDENSIEYSKAAAASVAAASAGKPIKGARVCIELNLPGGESAPSHDDELQRDEVTTV